MSSTFLSRHDLRLNRDTLKLLIRGLSHFQQDIVRNSSIQIFIHDFSSYLGLIFIK